MEEAKEVEDLRILVIDDDAEVLEMMVEILEHVGYAPRSTTDSREAQALWRRRVKQAPARSG